MAISPAELASYETSAAREGKRLHEWVRETLADASEDAQCATCGSTDVCAHLGLRAVRDVLAGR